MPRIIVLNTGSNSLKFKLFNYIKNEHRLEVEKKGEVERICAPGGPKNYVMALDMLFEGFGRFEGLLNKVPDLAAIGHRVVYCGDECKKTELITQKFIDNLQKYSLNAPLHNPKILEVMKAIVAKSGQSGHRAIPNYAVFDTAYFKDLPNITKIYPIPYYFYEDYHIKRYGFHGISHQSAVNVIINKYGSEKAQKIICVHLGEGSSIAAILDGKPIDTSMGFTPLEGLMMMTRSGDIDAGIIHWLIENKVITHPDVDRILNFESGLRGISGLNCGMEDMLNIAGYKVDDEYFKPSILPENVEFRAKDKTKLAIQMYIYRIKKYIGAYYSILGGLDQLIFTGKIGAGSVEIRKMILKNLKHITKNAKINVVIPNEELQIAKEIVPFINKKRG